MNDTFPHHIVYDGEFHRSGEQLLSAQSRAIRYGDGCFETFRSYQGRFLKLDAHLGRLKKALQYLSISLPIDLNEDWIRDYVTKLLQRNKLLEVDAVVRMQIWRGGNRGFSVTPNSEAHYVISAAPLPDIPDSVKLATVETKRIPSQALNPQFKLSNSINYIQAATEAAKKQADDALMQTVDGYISETTIANCFWLQDEAVFTPSLGCDILPGITREVLIHILEKEFDIFVMEDKFGLDELLNADAAWICNSIREVVAIRSLDEKIFSISHPLLKKLKAAFRTYRIEEAK